MAKQKNDATASVLGILLQISVAVLKCFEMTKGQKVFIERYGDVTVKGSQQLELKYYGDPLTDNHLNLWKTLSNWLQPNFDESHYSSLILSTTQTIGKNSALQYWNILSAQERLTVLSKIYEKAKQRSAKNDVNGSKIQESEALKLQHFVMHPDRVVKLNRVVAKFTIAAQSKDLMETYDYLKQVHCKGVLEGKCDAFLDALIGYIISPAISNGKSWVISYDDFKSKVSELTSTFCKETRQFPTKYMTPRDAAHSTGEFESTQDNLFVKKIYDIEYDEAVHDAIFDYLCATKTVAQEFRDYEVPTEHYTLFANEVLMI